MGFPPTKSFEEMAKDEAPASEPHACCGNCKPREKITMEVSGIAEQTGVVTFARPGYLTFRVDISGRLHLMVYDGLDKSSDNDCIGAFDGTNNSNKNWES
jgi:hypothetical protein